MNFGNIKLSRKLASLKMYLQPNFKKALKVGYFNSPNFGDALNPIILKLLGVEEVVNIPTEFYKKEHLICIGSMLQVANEESIIWGAGFIGDRIGFYYNPPKKVLAVRGPKTKLKLENMGINCPDVYGDPALLLPGIYQPKEEKKYKYGIVPHYLNYQDEWLSPLKNRKDVKIIDVMNSNALNVVDIINECEIILSSSLHGIIVADAYRIPSYWLKFKKNIGPDDFKFYDYFGSVNRLHEKPFYTLEHDFQSIINGLYDYKFVFNPFPLLKSFPFKIKEEIIQKFRLLNNIN